MCIYSPMPHTLSYCALIGKCGLIRSNTVCRQYKCLVFTKISWFDNYSVHIKCLVDNLSVPYFLGYKTNFFSFQNNLKDLDPSHKMDLDL